MNKNDKVESTKRLVRSVHSLLVLQAANFILPLLTLPYLAHVLGNEKFGLLAFATGLTSYLTILADFGFSLSATREISIHRTDAVRVNEIFNAVTILRLMLALIGFAILLLLVFSVERFRTHAAVYFSTFGTVIGQVLFPTFFFQGIERMGYVTFLNVFSKTLFTGAIFVFVTEKSDYLLVPILTSLGYVISGVWANVIARKDFGVKFEWVPIYKLRSYFLDSFQYFLSRASVSLYTSSNVFILGLATNNSIVGDYSMAEKLYAAAQAMFQPLATAIYPYIAKEKNSAIFWKIFKLVVFSSFALIATILLFKIPVTVLVYGAASNHIVESVFKVLLVACLIVIPSILLGYPYLGALGHGRYVNFSVLIGAVIHSALLFILFATENLSAITVGFAVVITETFVLSYRAFWAKKIRFL